MTHAPRLVWRSNLPAWLVILAAPLAVLFLLSLAAASALLAGAALLAAFVLPRLRRQRPRDDGRTIELAQSEFRRLPRTDAERDREG